MGSLHLLFVVGVLVYSIINVISYLSKRSDNKGALQRLLTQRQPDRQMSSEELSAVQPFLVNPLKPSKIAPLVNEGVYRISGEYERHGIKTSNGGESMHDTLNGVDVVLPYDCREFMQPWNKAEVVLTEKFAIVIRLNDEFDLMGGRERSLLKQKQEQQWSAGQTGELPDTGFTAGLNENAAEEAAELKDIAQVRILGQRQETPAEVELRVNAGVGWVPALLLIPAFILLVIAGHVEVYGWWLLPSLVIFAPALYFIWWPRRGTPRKVNRVEGCLTTVSLPNPYNSASSRNQLFLGDKFPIVLPPFWAKWTIIPADRVVDVDMRVDDYSVVRLGNGLSLDKEQCQFPAVYWGRHLLWAMIAFVMLGIAALNIDHMGADITHVRAALQGGTSTTLNQPAQVLANPPSTGSLVHIKGQANCQIAAAEGVNPMPLDCSNVRWGGAIPKLTAVNVTPELLSVYNGDILQAQHDSMMESVLRMKMAAESGDYGVYNSVPSILRITQFSALVKAVQQACEGKDLTADINTACQNQQSLLGMTQDNGGLLVIPTNKEKSQGALGWKTLLAQANDGRLTEAGDTLLVGQETLAALRDGLKDIAQPRIQQVYAPALATALASQRGGVVLRLPAVPEPVAVETPAEPVAENEDPKSTDWAVQWLNYQNLSQAKKQKPVDIQGLVVHSAKDENGDWVLELDTERNQNNYQPALIRLIGILLAAVFVLVHGSLFVFNVTRARKREKALEAYLQQQASVF